jgi:hypothetical protein
MSPHMDVDRRLAHGRLVACLAALVLIGGCASDGGGSVSTSMHVGVGYGSYYGPGWYGGYYEPYPPVVVVDPDRPIGDRPIGERPDRPTTLPADAGTRPAGMAPRASTAPSRPSNVSRPTSRPSPRPAPRPMPRMGRR